MDEALVGDIDAPIIPEPDEVVEEYTERAQEFAAVGNDGRWKIIETYIDERIMALQDSLKTSIDVRSNLSEIGEKAIVLEIVKEELLALKTQVTANTEAVNEARRDTKQPG